MCGGGDEPRTPYGSPGETMANLLGKEEARREEAFGAASPFFKSRMAGGLPYRSQLLDFSGGTLARSAAPLRASLFRRNAMGGGNPNDPAFMQTLADFNAKLARGFDDRTYNLLMMDEATRQAAAQSMANIAGGSNPAQLLSLWTNWEQNQ